MEILRDIEANFNLDDFRIYRRNPEFDIFLFREDDRIELAVLRQLSKPHYHTLEAGYFLFLDKAILQLGGCLNRNTGFISSYDVESGSLHIIAPFVIHSAGPQTGTNEARLLIRNEEGMRERNNNAYPDDTFFPIIIKEFAHYL